MIEIEGKILEVDKEKVILLLEQLGAKKVFEGKVSARFFDFEDGRLGKKHIHLRLRTKGEKAELTCKQRISKAKVKIMQEDEIAVEDYEAMEKILVAIGLQEIYRYEKHRLSFVLLDVRFEFDTFPNIPTYLEIETTDVKILEKYVEKLGYSMKDVVSFSGKEVLKYYASKES